MDAMSLYSESSKADKKLIKRAMIQQAEKTLAGNYQGAQLKAQAKAFVDRALAAEKRQQEKTT